MAANRPEFAILTPDGRGAVGVIAVRGPNAIESVDRLFRPTTPGSLRQPPTGRIRHGRIGLGEGDEVVVITRPGPSPIVEIHGHGGRAALSMITKALESVGVRPVSSRRSRSSPAWDAYALLPAAASRKAAQALLDQASGLLERAMEELASRVETDPSGVLETIDRWLDRGETLGFKLAEGWTVALAGPPNAGKSRLLNAIAGFDRAIVADRPGTTRDVIQLATACRGWPVRFDDTAGLRPTHDPLEQAGQDRARSAHHQADLVVVVVDGSQPLGEPELAVLADHPAGLRVASKSDLDPAWPAEQIAALPVSGQTGEGVGQLLEAIADRLVPQEPAADEPLPTCPEHGKRLRRIREWIRRGQTDRARRILIAWAGRSGGAMPTDGPAGLG